MPAHTIGGTGALVERHGLIAGTGRWLLRWVAETAGGARASRGLRSDLERSWATILGCHRAAARSHRATAGVDGGSNSLLSVGATRSTRLNRSSGETSSWDYTLTGPIQSDTESPAIVIFVKESNKLTSLQLELVLQCWLEVELDAVNH